MTTLIKVPWGTTKTYDVLATNEVGEAVPLAGKTLRFIAKIAIADDDDDAVFILTEADGITVPGDDGPNSAIIRISPESTTTLARAVKTSLHFQLLLIDGSDRFELDAGILVVNPSVSE